MENGTRLVATLIVWGGMVGVMGMLVGATMSADNIDLVGQIMLFIIVLALFEAVKTSTQAIWSRVGRTAEPPRESLPLAKSKRTMQNRVDRLLDELNETELYDLEARLLARQDDELRDRVWR